MTNLTTSRNDLDPDYEALTNQLKLLEPLAIWVTTSLLGLSLTSALGSALAFFLYDVPKILMLLAAGLGIVTPFCSCSAVPLFIGFVKAGVPMGVTFSFLISAPMVNEIALVCCMACLVGKWPRSTWARDWALR